MTQPLVRRFWLEFDLPPWDAQPDRAFAVLYRGVGVTGFDAADCLWMIRDLLPVPSLPPVRSIAADVSLAGFAAPAGLGLGVPVWRGVWFPPENLRTSGTWRPCGAPRAINPTTWPPNPRQDLAR